MHRRFHKRRWTLTCFLAAMVILPTAAVLQKDNDAQNSLPHMPMPKKRVLHSLFHGMWFPTAMAGRKKPHQ